jgi:hypothetical protein
MPLCSLARADDAATVKKQIQAEYAKRITALKNHDIRGFMLMAADDYRGPGNLNKSDIENSMEGFASPGMKINSYSYNVQHLKVNGDLATGKATFKFDTTMVDSQGMMGTKGQAHRMKADETFLTTYEKVDGRWKLSQETYLGQPRFWLDGKLYNPMAQPADPQKPKS